ncbi:MAG TPA: S9 family peptidase [bacterium]|jgi:dipeptidyl aminopeptidase/acylaminoacyl peptidase
MRIRTVFVALLILSATAFAQSGKDAPSLLNQGKYIPDIATFLNIGGCMPDGLSWDGKDVYFSSTMSGASQVYRITEEGWPYQLTTFDDGVEFFTLSYGGNMAVVGASVGGDENAQLYLLDTKTGRTCRLTDNGKVQFGSVVWTRDDKSIYFRSNEENGKDFFIYRMSIADGKYSKVFGDTAHVRGSNAIADLSVDGTKMIVANYSSNVNNDLYFVDLATGKYALMTPHKGDVQFGNVTLMPDNKTVYLTSNDNSEGISRPAKMVADLKKKPDPKKVVEWIKDGWLDPKWDTESYGFSRDFKYQVAITNEDGYNRLKMRDADSKKELPNPPLDGLLGGGSFDQNGECLISFSSPTRAPDVWKWNPQTKDLKQLTHSIYAGIDRGLFREPKLVRFKSFDGLEIPAFLYLPPDYKEGQAVPFIIDAHGGPEGQFQPAFIRNFQYLMLNGYGILAPNPRGSSGYGRTFMSLDNYKKRKDSLKDYKAAADWLVAQGYTKPGMMGIRGGSYGGYVVLGMITEYPDLFSAAIDIVGIANFKTFLKNTAAYRRAIREAEYGPLADSTFLDQISPIHKANLVKTPLLIVHGANDPRVPVGEARQMLAAVAQNGTVVDSLIFADEGHGSGKRVNSIKEYRKHVEFFDRFLKPR